MVDCDPGIDDALALLMLARLHRAGSLVLASVSAVSGNVSASQAAQNAASTLERAGVFDVPVVQGADKPLQGHAPATATEFHGPDGLGGLATGPSTPPTLAPRPGEELAARIAACPEAPWLLAIGPLTNVALALDAAPELVDRVSRVVVMGGALGAGNVTPWAEFNFYVDPLAADIVCRAGLPVELVPLDISEQLTVQPDDARAFGSYARELVVASSALHKAAHGLAGTLVHDAIAAAVLLDPATADLSPAGMSVELRGERAGRLVQGSERADRPTLSIVHDIDMTRVKEHLTSLLAE